MEKNDPLFPVFERTLDVHGKLTDSRLEAISAERTISGQEGEYTERLIELRQAVLENPDLSDFQKAAWLEAFNRQRDDPEKMELAALEFAELLAELNGVFELAGIPVWTYERVTTTSIDTFTTDGGGLRFTGGEYDAATIRINDIHGSHYDEPRETRLWLRGINAAFFSAEEVDSQVAEDSLENPNYSGSRAVTYIIGEDAIVRFAERMFVSHGHHGLTEAERLIRKAREVGVDLEACSEIIRQHQNERRSRAADTIATKMLANIMEGYPDFNLFKLSRWAEEEDVSPALIIERIQALYKIGEDRLQAWLDEIKAGLEQTSADPTNH